MNKNELLRRIPKVDEVLAQPLVFDCFAKSGREAVAEAVREVIQAANEAVELRSMSENIPSMNDIFIIAVNGTL